MKKVLVDTNVVLDVLLEREPHVSPSTAVWAAVAFVVASAATYFINDACDVEADRRHGHARRAP